LTLAAAPPLVVWTDCALGTDDRFLRAVRLAGNPWREERLLAQLQRLVDAGNSVLVVEHDMSLVAACDWVVDLGPGAGDEGGRLVARDPPQVAARQRGSRTAPWLAKELGVSHA
jgi:excinuclease ABC subunit A